MLLCGWIICLDVEMTQDDKRILSGDKTRSQTANFQRIGGVTQRSADDSSQEERGSKNNVEVEEN